MRADTTREPAALKDALYFGGSSPETMRRLFPPPAYELPNDVFFEVTGVLQLLLGSVAGHHLYRLLLARRRALGASVTASVYLPPLPLRLHR
jgi:hypothetical protein